MVAAESEALPSWFVVTLVGALCAILGFGTMGLGLAIVGALAPLPTFLLGAVATAALVRLVAPWKLATTDAPGTRVPAALTVVLAAVGGAVAIVHESQHVLIDRDPGGYVNTARWLATHHGLTFHGRAGAFKHTGGLFYFSPAVYDRAHGHLYFQFSHLLPVLLAEARWIGGDHLMFSLPPVLGAIGLLAFYALATHFVRPWFAFAATAALSVDLVQLHFSRDAYSELPTQVVLLGALWLLTRAPAAPPAIACFTGLLFGATVMARIDGPIYLVAIPFVLGAAVLARRRGDPDGRARLVAAGWLIAGAVATITVGYVDVTVRSPGYVKSLGDRVPLLYIALAIACLGAAVLGRVPERLVAWGRRLAEGRAADAAAIAVVVVLAAMWFVRPYVQKTIIPPAQQPFLGLTGANARTFHERSVVWLSWYLGPLTLAAAIVGLAFLVRAALRGAHRAGGVLVVAFLPVAAVYLWNPNISNDHIWVMRRYLPLVLPGLILFAFVIVEWLAARVVSARAGSRRTIVRAGAVVLIAASIAWPLVTDAPVAAESAQAGFLGKVETLCHTLGPKAAVVVLEGSHLELVLPQTLRSFCGVPVAIRFSGVVSFTISRADMVKLAAAWQRQGRTLFVVGDSPGRITRLFPGVTPVGDIVAVNRHDLRVTTTVRPHGYQTERYRFVVAKVPTTATG